MKLKALALAAFVLFFFNRCNQEDDQVILMDDMEALNIVGEMEAEITFSDDTSLGSNARTTAFTETFENGSKGSYSSGSVTLNSGAWSFNNALLGSLSTDRKTGSKSVRIRQTGSIRMNFDMDEGATTVSLSHARFGNDGSSTWRLVASYNGGSSWSYVGTAITTSSSSLETVNYTINTTEAVRFGVAKLTGGSNRVNIDNFVINTSDGGDNSGGDNDEDDNGGGTASRDNNMTFGNPSDASTSANNYLVNRNEYSYSYNNSKGIVNWVSWHLSTAWMGSASRQNDFRTDTALPASFFRASSTAFSGSGFDRGHLCPSADRTHTTSANSSTFYMANMIPQAPNNNRQTWRLLEEYLRDLANDGYEIHILAGGAGSGGTGSNGSASSINNGNIEVPASIWKVALVLPNGSNDISRVTTSTRVIAVNVPNVQNVNTSNWGIYRTSVDYIERITGLDLYEDISDSIEDVLESGVDNGPTN